MYHLSFLTMLLCLYFVAGGAVASILVVFCLCWIGVVDHVGFENKGTMLNLPGIPIVIGLYGYCYSGHAVFPNISSSLKNRNQFPSILSPGKLATLGQLICSPSMFHIIVFLEIQH